MEAVEKLLTALEMESLITRPVAQFSGGQRQRVSIARTLMQHPSILIADEPFPSIDPATEEKILDLLFHQEVPFDHITLSSHHPLVKYGECFQKIKIEQGRCLLLDS